MNIKVMYSCPRCDVRDCTLDVPARESATDVVVWMDATILLIARDHSSKFPRCIAKKLHDLKIPITGAEWVGGPPIQ